MSPEMPAYRRDEVNSWPGDSSQAAWISVLVPPQKPLLPYFSDWDESPCNRSQEAQAPGMMC